MKYFRSSPNHQVDFENGRKAAALGAVVADCPVMLHDIRGRAAWLDGFAQARSERRNSG